MMEAFLLGLLSRMKWLIRLSGADFELVHAIVAVKLKTDNRRQLLSSTSAKSDSANSFTIALLVYLLFGLIVSLFVSIIPSFILKFILLFSYLLVMVAMTLITDFSTILLDTSDNTIILPRPVDSKTLFIARLTHIMLYLGQLIAALSLVPAISVLSQFGVVALLCFLALAVLIVVTAVVVTNAVYLVVLHNLSAEKIKNAINYVQIAMAVVFMGVFQIFPTLLQRLELNKPVFVIEWWHYLLPPVWMAGVMESVITQAFDAPHLRLSCLAILFPFAGLFFVNKYLTPVFRRKLGELSTVISHRVPQQIKRQQSWKERWLNFLSRLFVQKGAEQGAFQLVYRMLGRDRKLKLKIYPAIGYIIIIGLVFAVRGETAFGATTETFHESKYHLSLLYITFMMLQVAFYEMPYSDDFKAGWVYYSAAITSPGIILSATIKAIFVRLFLPVYSLVIVFVMALWGTGTLLDIVVAALNNYLLLQVIAAIDDHKLPFCTMPSVTRQSGNTARNTLALLLIGVVGAAHYFLSRYTLVLVGAIPFQLVAIFLLQRAYRRIGWADISS